MTTDRATLIEDERWAFRVLRLAMNELATHPLDDELGLARVRQRCAEARANWATALRVLDGVAASTVEVVAR